MTQVASPASGRQLVQVQGQGKALRCPTSSKKNESECVRAGNISYEIYWSEVFGIYIYTPEIVYI